MRAFISYSFDNREVYLVSLLSRQLQENGFEVVVPSNLISPGQPITQLISQQIRNSNLFVGIITKAGHFSKHTLDEWHLAEKNLISSIVLIEKGLRISSKAIDSKSNLIRFDRNNPEPSINKLVEISKASKASVKQILPDLKSQVNDSLKTALAVGAVAVALAALVSLLSGDKK